MRDYDDYEDENVRLYTPVFQRVIVLAAVIVAVPVMMWTITTFVRSYVARPKVPALERLASTSASAPIAAVAATPSAPAALREAPVSRGDSVAAHEPPPPPAETKKSGPILAAMSDSPSASMAANTPSAAPRQADLRQGDLRQADLRADLGQSSSPAMTGTTVAAAVSGAAEPTASLPRVPQPARPAENGTLSSGANPADRNLAWPNPNTARPPDFSASRRSSAPASPAPAPVSVAALEVVMPADQPIRGPVPLPRHRPGVVAMAANGQASASSTGAVPLPRVRPVGAAAEPVSTFSALPSGARPDLESAH